MDLSFLSNVRIDDALIAREFLKRKAKPFTVYYPDVGDFSRFAYPKMTEFFEAGAKYTIRLVIAGNRVGKTEGMGGYETALHLTGLYPDWWTGRRFDRPTKAVCASHTTTTTRDICQFKLFGEPSECGTGLIPMDLVGKISHKMGVNNAYDTVKIRHVSGGESVLRFLAFEQGRKKFEGTERDFCWLDEEPPLDVAMECLMRTMTTEGILIITFTPLQGMSDTVQFCLENSVERGGNVYIQTITWDDVPHISEDKKIEYLALMPAYQRDARSKGIPALGSGAIYPIPEDFVFIDDFPLAPHFKKVYALDVGWNKTAALWGAYDYDNDVIYIYSEHYRGEAEASIHASAIKSRGEWIRGVIDPASRGRSQADGKKLVDLYRAEGLSLSFADNQVEAGVFKVFNHMVQGKVKIFKSCVNTLKEFRLYRRDDDGKIVKKSDHLMDGLRYLIMSGKTVASYKHDEHDNHYQDNSHDDPRGYY